MLIVRKLVCLIRINWLLPTAKDIGIYLFKYIMRTTIKLNVTVINYDIEGYQTDVEQHKKLQKLHIVMRFLLELLYSYNIVYFCHLLIF